MVVHEARKEAGILSEYKDLTEVFFKTRAQAVAEHVLQTLKIHLVEGEEPP